MLCTFGVTVIIAVDIYDNRQMDFMGFGFWVNCPKFDWGTRSGWETRNAMKGRAVHVFIVFIKNTHEIE